MPKKTTQQKKLGKAVKASEMRRGKARQKAIAKLKSNKKNG